MGLLPSFRSEDPDGIAAYCAEFEDQKQAASARLDRMVNYRNEGNEGRNQEMMQRAGQSPAERDYGRGSKRSADERLRHHIPLPLAKALNVKHSYRISGKLPDAIVDRRDESAEERYRSDTMEKIVWAIMRVSRGATQFSSAAWDGSELGASCFDLYFDVKESIPVFRAVDPAGLIVVPGVDDPHQFQRVYRFWDVPTSSLRAEYAKDPTVRVDQIQKSHMDGMTEMTCVAQLCDTEKLVRFIPSCGVKLYEQTHNFGFTPYVVIPNIGPERDIWGWADYEFVRQIGQYISAMFSREADILRAVANGTYIERGTGQNPAVVQRALSEGGIIPSRKEGTLDPVQPPDIPAFAAQHSANAMEMFKMLGFAPDAAWGNGGAGSGSDRGLMLQPLVEFTAMKQLNWEAGLGRLFSMAYRMLEDKLVGTAKYRGSKPSAAGNRRLPFSFQLGPDAVAQTVPSNVAPDDPGAGFDDTQIVELPTTPKELFDGDYEVRFVWNNRIDPDDPAYVLSEIGKFQHGTQSLETTLERLGFEAPQDEIKRIEKEAELYPWLNQGMIALIRAQLSGQGAGGGNPDNAGNVSGDASGAAQTAAPGPGGALGADAAGQALGSGYTGPAYGGA